MPVECWNETSLRPVKVFHTPPARGNQVRATDGFAPVAAMMAAVARHSKARKRCVTVACACTSKTRLPSAPRKSSPCVAPTQIRLRPLTVGAICGRDPSTCATSSLFFLCYLHFATSAAVVRQNEMEKKKEDRGEIKERRRQRGTKREREK